MTRSKMVVPLPNQLLKMLKQCEVYLMEEAITDQIIRASAGPIPPANQDAFHADAMNDLQQDFSHRRENDTSDIVNLAADQSVYSKGTNKQQVSAYEKALHPKMPGQRDSTKISKDEDLLSPDIVDIKTKLNESHTKQQ